MKAILVIDLPNDLDISLDEIKADITVLSKDFRKSMLYLKYKNIALKPLPQKKILDEELFMSGIFRLIQARFTGWNDCLDEIIGGEKND